MKMITSLKSNGKHSGTHSQQQGSSYGLLLGALICLLLPAVTLADAEDGRYRAIVLEQGGGYSKSAALSPKVFILDSRDGHMWTWEQNAQLKDAQGNLQFGNMTVYQGKLKVGSRIGDVVEQSR